jgi:hypothetical protein
LLRKSLAIVLLLAFSTQLSAKALVIGYYYLNQKYIAENLCVNKEKPQMDCNGKCHLKKQLSKQEQAGHQSVPNLKEIGETLVFFETLLNEIRHSNKNFPIQTGYYFSITDHGTEPAVHPPCC